MFLGLHGSRSLDPEHLGCSWYQETRDNVLRDSLPVKLAASLQSPRLEALLMYSAVPSREVSCEKSQDSYVLQELDQRYL